MFVISVKRERVPTPLCVVPDVLERPEPLDDEEDPLEDYDFSDIETDDDDPLFDSEDPKVGKVSSIVLK